MGLGAVLIAAVASCGMAGRVSEKNTPMSLEALYAYCGIPSICGSAPAWEGALVIFRGHIDPDNIFDKRHDPRLAHEKFKVTDRQGRSIEVWVKTLDSRSVFSKVYDHLNSPVTIRGRLASVNMPIMGRCQLGAKVWINDSSQIQSYVD